MLCGMSTRGDEARLLHGNGEGDAEFCLVNFSGMQTLMLKTHHPQPCPHRSPAPPLVQGGSVAKRGLASATSAGSISNVRSSTKLSTVVRSCCSHGLRGCTGSCRRRSWISWTGRPSANRRGDSGSPGIRPQRTGIGDALAVCCRQHCRRFPREPDRGAAQQVRHCLNPLKHSCG